MKKPIIIAICVIAAVIFLVVSFLGFDTIKDGFEIKSDGGYLAGETIPSGAKIYPIVDEGLPMSLDDVNGFLTDEDIFTLTKYVDLWCSSNDSRGDGFLEEDVSKFTNSTRIQEIKDAIKNNDLDYKVEGTQILTMSVDMNHLVEVPYILKLSGKNDTEGYPEGTYEAIHALQFKKVNGNWYECGVAFIAFGEAGAFDYQRDEITGLYTIIPVGNVLKMN